MEVKFYNQPKDVKIFDLLSQRLGDKFSKVWICAGFVKDSAIDILLPSIELARKNNVSIECIFGLDKKNTSKDMLSKLLNIGCKVRYHINDDDSKFETRAYLFEHDTDKSYVYMTGSKFSEGGITDNVTLVQELIYDAQEKKEFNLVRAALESGFVDSFEYLTDEKLAELARTGEIQARITERKIPSISELYSDGNTAVITNEYSDEESSNDYKSLVNSDIDITFEDNESVTVQHSLGEEIEHQLKKKETDEEKVVSKILSPQKASDFENMTTLIIPILKSNIKENELKLPTAVTSLMNKFFGYPDGFHVSENEKGEFQEKKIVGLEIFENVEKKQVNDQEGQFIISAKYLTIHSEMLKEYSVDGDDILRIIKNSDNSYRIEIIKNNSSEFQIWSEFCTAQVKGFSKGIGIL